MTLVHLAQKTEILKYQIAEYSDPLDYMRVAMIQPFNSNTVSLLVKYIPSLEEKIAFKRLISLVAKSILGPVTMHI